MRHHMLSGKWPYSEQEIRINNQLEIIITSLRIALLS